MSRFQDLPSLLLPMLRFRSFSFDVVGTSIDGGRNTFGAGQSIEITGGGLVRGSYDGCMIRTPEQHAYIGWLGRRLTGGYRFINVPIWTDLMGPFPVIGGVPRGTIRGISHSDGSFFADGAGYSQTTVYGEIVEAAALNAGVLKIRMHGLGRPLRWSDWFSILHPVKGWRAYSYWDVISATDEASPVYTLAISPALREAVEVGERVEFVRPMFVAKFPLDFSLPWGGSLVNNRLAQASPSIQFVEAF